MEWIQMEGGNCRATVMSTDIIYCYLDKNHNKIMVRLKESHNLIIDLTFSDFKTASDAYINIISQMKKA